MERMNPTYGTSSGDDSSRYSVELPTPPAHSKLPEHIKLVPVQPLPMVGWYDPGQLMQTAIRTVVSTLFGQNADRRLLEALTFQQISIYDYTFTETGDLRDEITIDYVADTGDGWNSTYSVAYWLTQPQLNLRDSEGRDRSVARSDILVFGGDEVYPTPGREEYSRRLVAAFETARAYSDPPSPHVYAVPGNHDWYDSLVAFTRLFISRDFFAGWFAPQTRSYFALHLPHGWWLVGTDVQLSSDIDKPQLDYFRAVVSKMEPGDQVILCTAEPHWVYEMEPGRDGATADNNLTFLEEQIFQGRIAVWLAGDLHHYRHHQAGDRHKITAGGGGAFLHPTHVGESSLRDGFTLQQPTFPDQRTSSRLAWANLLFLFKNPKFGLLTALLYFLAGRGILESGATSATAIALAALSSGMTVFWTVLTLAGFLLFTDTRSRTYRLVMGTLHGSAHIAAALALSSAVGRFLAQTAGFTPGSLGLLLLSVPLVMAGGYLLGPILMGIYLLISINVFGRHRTEAFSSMVIPDWKNFLRLKIGADGLLTIYPVGIRRVARRWKPVNEGNLRVSRMEPDDPRASPPELIGEKPVEVPAPVRRVAGHGSAAGMQL